MKQTKNKIVAISILALNFIATMIAYPKLPSRVATHWGTGGEVDGYMNKGWGSFFLPLLLVGLYLLLYYVPKIDPRKENIKKFRKAYNAFLVIFLLFMTALHLYTLAWNLGYHLSMLLVMPIMMAIFFWSIGSLLGDAEPNYFIGIRTPWTLADDEVWRKTHILSAKLFKGAAAICLIGLLLPHFAFLFILFPILCASLGSVLYSYSEFKNISKK